MNTDTKAADTPAEDPKTPEAPEAAAVPAAIEHPSADEANIAAMPAGVIEGKDWRKGALVVYNGTIPASEKRPVIVCETRRVDGTLDDKRRYPAKGDLYYRTEDATDFGEHGPVEHLGVTIRQGHLWGFSDHPLFVNVGPAHPAYAAANLAYTRAIAAGHDRDETLEIEVQGLSDEEKERLTPWFAKLPTSKVAAANVVVKLT